MGDENIISWNIPNFITFVLMVALIWVIVGSASHILWRKKNTGTNPFPSTEPATATSPGG